MAMLHGRNRPLTPQPYTWVSLCRKFHHGTFKNNRTLGLNDFPNLSQHRGIRKLSSKPSGDLRVDAHGLQSCLMPKKDAVLPRVQDSWVPKQFGRGIWVIDSGNSPETLAGVAVLPARFLQFHKVPERKSSSILFLFVILIMTKYMIHNNNDNSQFNNNSNIMIIIAIILIIIIIIIIVIIRPSQQLSSIN